MEDFSEADCVAASSRLVEDFSEADCVAASSRLVEDFSEADCVAASSMAAVQKCCSAKRAQNDPVEY